MLPPAAAAGYIRSMNDHDKAGRYLIKCEPQDFLRWQARNQRLHFHAWIDARRLALPDQRDLTHDLVAAVGTPAGFEAICVELEAEARADALSRQLGYQARLWNEPGDERSVPLQCVSGIIFNLTGRGRTRELTLRSAAVPGCRLELAVQVCNLAEEDAATLVAEVAAGQRSPWLLGWISLMRGGGEPAIIERWRQIAEQRLLDERQRGILGLIARTFATRAGRRPAWPLGSSDRAANDHQFHHWHR